MITAVLYQQVRPPYWRRHPWITGVGAVLACWLAITGSQAIVAIAAVIALLIYVDRRRRALARRDAGLRARADLEHRLCVAGDPRGLYGRYPPVQAGWFRDPVYPGLVRYFDGAVWTPYTVHR
jgi:Protein of unknown function (DUF2510)